MNNRNVTRMTAGLLCLSLCSAVMPLTASAAKKRVLFIGNSITYFNDMPQVFRDIANQKGDSVELMMYAPGGTGFQHHVVDAQVYNHFRDHQWDVIVLQPGSNESLGVPPAQPRPQTLAQGRQLIDSALHYSPCARIIFYEISNGVTGSDQPALNQYNTIMGHIRTTATYLADSTGWSFAPVGEAFRYAWNKDQSVLLWGAPGDIHPNIKGSYMASCTFYATIFNKPSAGSTVYNGNTAADAQYYQHIADSIVLQHTDQWRIDTAWHKARFSFSGNGLTRQFQNMSTGADSARWFFHNGTTTTTANPSFTYAQGGTYPVKMVAYFGPCSDTVQRQVTVGGGTGIGKEQNSGSLVVSMYPNPTTGMLHLSLPASLRRFTVQLLDYSGRLLLEQQDKPFLNLGQLSAGMYFIRISDQQSGQQFIGKVQKQ